MELVNLFILTLISLILFIVPVICWIDTLFPVSLATRLPFIYIYYMIEGKDLFSIWDYPIYILILWLSVPFGFISGMFLEIFLVPSFITGGIGSYFLGYQML